MYCAIYNNTSTKVVGFVSLRGLLDWEDSFRANRFLLAPIAVRRQAFYYILLLAERMGWHGS